MRTATSSALRYLFWRIVSCEFEKEGSTNLSRRIPPYMRAAGLMALQSSKLLPLQALMLHAMRRTNIILISGGIVFGLVLVVELLRFRSLHAATLRPPEELAVTSCPTTPIKIPTLSPPESPKQDKVSYRHNLTISPDPTLSFRGKRLPARRLAETHTHLFPDNLWSDKKYITVC